MENQSPSNRVPSPGLCPPKKLNYSNVCLSLATTMVVLSAFMQSQYPTGFAPWYGTALVLSVIGAIAAVSTPKRIWGILLTVVLSALTTDSILTPEEDMRGAARQAQTNDITPAATYSSLDTATNTYRLQPESQITPLPNSTDTNNFTNHVATCNSPFKGYDMAIVNQVQKDWKAKLDAGHFAANSTGRVETKFTIHYDGTVTDCEVTSNTVSQVLAYICLQTLQELPKFKPFPSDMRRIVGANQRVVTFTFYYY